MTAYTHSSAHLSECGRYRYSLTRWWDHTLPCVVFIGLNPSTADAESDDPTIKRCVSFAKSWGCGGIHMLNLIPIRATDPDDMLVALRKLLPHEEHAMLHEQQQWYHAAIRADLLVVAAWGANARLLRAQVELVRATFPKLHYLTLTAEGHPGHPLYLKGDLRPIPWV